MGIYKYDFEDLSETSSGLSTLLSDFQNASEVQQEASDAFGYGSLIGAVEEFVDNWSANRDKQIEAIEGTQEALAEIVNNYEQLDSDGVAELQDQDS